MRVPAALTAGAVGLGLAISVAPAASAAVIGDFADGIGPWFTTPNLAASVDTAGGALCVDVPAGTANPWDAIVGVNGVGVDEGTRYAFTFAASGDPGAEVRVVVGQNGEPFGTVVDETITLAPEAATYDLGFTATATYPQEPAEGSPEGQVAFQLGGNSEAFTFCVDDVTLTGETEVLPQTSFAEGLGLWVMDGATVSATTVEGGTCFDVPGGTASPWDINLHLDGIAVEAEQNYVLRVTASGDPSRTIRAIVGEAGGTFRTVVDETPQLTAELQTFEMPFTAAHSFPADGEAPGQVALQVGGNDAFTFCVTEVSLVETQAPPPPYEPETGPLVRVNQVGYLTHGPKVATLVTEQTAGVAWQLLDGAAAVTSGTSVPRGVDPTSGLNVHTIDFSAVTDAGDGYTLAADGEVSYPFVIEADIYDQLRVDAASFFYPQRSGTEILGDVAGEEYARPAGHVGVEPNQGDTAVTCLPPGTLVVDGQDLYQGYTCDYTLDVTGGWYDAGDHGKYVVNGGISVAQLLSAYERSLTAMSADEGALADGTLRVPETGNEIPDILDEARWELDWMLKMQVPAGEQYAGMVHHKVTDVAWTGIPLYPHQDPQARYLHRPSTAATLNMAAVAAQGARVFAEYDPEFAAELLEAAEVAYAAALETPDLLAPNTNLHPNPGGGPYNDEEIEDEFYWAAAELYLTTGGQAYLENLQANAYHVGGEKDALPIIGFDWQYVAAQARIDLATVPSLLPNRLQVRQSVVDAAEEVVALQATQPFGQPYTGVEGGFEWGSNGKILNNINVLGTAFDLTGNPRYSHAALQGMDYILGRNALNISYVTGYGDLYAENQHSRWYAAQANSAYPHPPVGTVSGGPNSDIPDPVSGPLLEGCLPQFCYVDHIGAWGVNELTINWNSALVYAASFLADQDDALVEPAFPDVSLDDEFNLPIQWLVGEGITEGYEDGMFHPTWPISRQAMAAFLYRWAGEPEYTAPATSPFPDVPTSAVFYKEVAWLDEQDITTGYVDGTFRPTSPVSRQAMAAFLHRFFGEPEVTDTTPPQFADVAPSDPFFAEIEWLAQSQIAGGYDDDDTYRPAWPVSRQAMAAFLHRAATLPVDAGPPVG